ncbi:hypothetical protein KIW84_075599 [Lathyrus oleraceus]|uniref:WAC domain-containing protein n=1 Tax=Pisum sativum TaxID=3888 RepID=A0A9D4VU46_PEA|nr:hypothetical protein KIW84_075599 [Pisum sativum]
MKRRCEVTGKTGVTYEEALVLEQRATEKFLHFPKEFMTPALKIIQYSMLPLKELADSIAEKLQERLFVGAELYGKKDDDVCPCRILKVIQEGVNKYRHEVAWLDKNKNVSEKVETFDEDLVQKKPLFSRNILKSFIRESTYRNALWVLHDKLTQNQGTLLNTQSSEPRDIRLHLNLCNIFTAINHQRRPLTARSVYYMEKWKTSDDDASLTPERIPDVVGINDSPSCDDDPGSWHVGEVIERPLVT